MRKDESRRRAPAGMLALVLGASVVVAGLSVSSAFAKDEVIPVSEVPKVVMDAALREVPGLVVMEVERESKKDGSWHYELEGVVGDEKFEVEVSAEGVVLDVELGKANEKDRKTLSEENRRASADGGFLSPPTPRERAEELLPRATNKSAAGGIKVSAAKVHDLPTDESEIVSVASIENGLRTFSVSPAEPCSGGDSRLAVVDWNESGRATNERVVELGPGESTSVAALPGGRGAVVVMKDARGPNVRPGRALLVIDDEVVASVPVGIGPDSVAVSSDGALAVIACEASSPDDEDCPAEADAADLAGSIHVLALDAERRSLRSAAVISGESMYAKGLKRSVERAIDARDIEPEYAAIAPDGSYALVTLQEQSAVAVVDLRPVRDSAGRGEDPRRLGDAALAQVVLLPHDFEDRRGDKQGVQPDGIAITADGSMAITANEAHPRARELQGISILDLRGGPGKVRAVATSSVFALDPTLRTPERREKKEDSNLPRLDPEGVSILEVGDRVVAAIGLERPAPGEPTGSVLFVDVTGALDGRAPTRIARRLAGANEGASPEGIVAISKRGLVVVACEGDGGTLSWFGVGETLAEPTTARAEANR